MPTPRPTAMVTLSLVARCARSVGPPAAGVATGCRRTATFDGILSRRDLLKALGVCEDRIDVRNPVGVEAGCDDVATDGVVNDRRGMPERSDGAG